jgi:hypothetical protein
MKIKKALVNLLHYSTRSENKHLAPHARYDQLFLESKFAKILIYNQEECTKLVCIVTPDHSPKNVFVPTE